VESDDRAHRESFHCGEQVWAGRSPHKDQVHRATGFGASSSGIDVYDVHKGTLQREIGVVEPDIPNINQAATIDNTGTVLFLLTNSGLDVIEDAPPLSVRSASPLPNADSAGTVITLRGAGFVSGATVTIGGHTVPTMVSDAQTLSFTLPSAVSDIAFTVSNPDGSSYTY
jgi:hypothetical protein